jgi:hypothetical protein
MKKEQFRNWLHVLGGSIIGLILSLTFDGVIIPAQIIFTIMWVGIPSTMWEWGWNMYNKSVVDYLDVVRAVIAGLVVVMISNFLK